MLINEIAVETPEVLQKRIEALQAMIDDQATTPGEKENAASLLQKVQAKLKANFPNYVPQPKTTSSTPYPSQGDWFSNMADAYGKAMDKEEAEIKRYGKPMNVTAMLRGEGIDGKKYTWTEEEVMPFVKKLRQTGAELRKRHIPGYENDFDYREPYKKAKRLIEKWCPIEREKIKAKEYAAYKAADIRNDKKNKEKRAAQAKAQKASGLSTKEAAKIDPDLVKRASSAMNGQPTKYGKWSSSEFKGSSFFYWIKYMKSSSIQAGLAKLESEDLNKLHDVVSKIATTGGENAYTEAQKKFVLNSIDVLRRNGKPSPPGKSWRYKR